MFGLRKYIYCSVLFDSGKSYYYRTNNTSITTGTKVIVPVGKYNAQKVGIVISTGIYKRSNAPYPVRQTKEIISIAGNNAERKVERFNRKLLKRIEREQKQAAKKLAEKNKRQLELEWIDRIEEYDALFND